jgi:hypothetical protein
VDPVDEVITYLQEKNLPVEYSVICNDLSHITKDRIKSILRVNKSFIRNEKKLYFHSNIIQFSDDELEGIENIINYYVDKNGYMTKTELIIMIEENFPDIHERYYFLKDSGLRDVIGYKLKEQFDFKANIISKKGDSLKATDIFSKFCYNNDTFSLEELKKLKNELGTNIPFEKIYSNKIRIGKNDFVTLKPNEFDVTSIDNILDTFATKGYISLKNIKHFTSFPESNYAWNTYLLESYVYKYSKKYKLLHYGFNEKTCAGGIVKKGNKIETFLDLIINVLLDNEINLNREETLNYLYENGYLGSRRFNDIDKALKLVKANKD